IVRMKLEEVRLSKQCDRENDKRNNHRNGEQRFPWVRPVADERCDEPAVLNLITHYTGQTQIAHQQKNGNNSKTEREFVREHLCTGTNSSQKRILGIRRPTANDDPVNAKRSDGEDKQNSDVYVGDHHRDSEQRATKRNNGDGDRSEERRVGKGC